MKGRIKFVEEVVTWTDNFGWINDVN